MLSVDPSTPDGRPLITVDITDLLPAGAAYGNCVVSCALHENSAEADADAATRIDGAVQPNGNLIQQFVRGGVAGADYVLTFLFTWSTGEIEPIQVKWPVRKYLSK